MMMETFTKQKLTLDSEYAILNTCIGWSPIECKERRTELEDYIHQYQEQIAQLDMVYGLGRETWPFGEKRPEQLLDVVTKVQELGPAATRNEARHAITRRLQLLNVSEHTVDSLVDAALRMWTLINFRNRDDDSVGRGRPCIEWRGNDSLATTLARLFPESTTELTLSQRRLSPHFTAANMADICGLKIEWATTLDDHLSLDRHRKVLQVFPLRAWLNIHAEHATEQGSVFPHPITKEASPDSVSCHTSTTQQRAIPYAVFPKELYEETSRTLDLLFPSWDPQTQRFLRKRGKTFHTVYSNPRLLDLKHYSYWKDKLLELNEDTFLAPPQGWAQLWRDRRDPQKFWTFWIALLVLWLAVVSTVATIIQTWATLSQPG